MVQRLTASLLICRRSQRSAFGSSAVCGKVYIVNRKRHASTASDNYISGIRFFRCSSWFLDGSFWSSMVSSFWFDVVRKAFERHLLNSNRRLCDDRTAMLVLLLLWSLCGFFFALASCVLVLFDVILISS